MAAIGKIRSWGPWLVGIIGLALFGFIATDFTKSCESHANEDRQQMGEVLGNKLQAQDWQQMVTEFKYVLQGMTGQENAEDERVRDFVWNQYVQYTIVSSEAEKLGLTVTDDEFKAVLEGGTNPLFRQMAGMFGQFGYVNQRYGIQANFINQQTGKFDYSQVSQLYTSLKQAADQQPQEFGEVFSEFENYWNAVEKMMRQQLLVNKYQQLLQACLISNPVAAKAAFDNNNVESKVILASLAYSDINDNDVKVDDKELQAKYDEQKEKYRWTHETRDIKYVVCPIVPSKADIENLRASLLDAAEQLAQVKADSLTIEDVVASHQSKVGYHGLGYTVAGLNNIQAGLADTIAHMEEGQTSAPFITSNNQTMILVKLLKKFEEVDSIQYQAIAVGGATPDAGKVSADSIIALVNGGMPFDSITFYGRSVEKEWNHADQYQNAENISADYITFLNAIKSAPVGQMTAMAIPNGYLVYKVLERKAPVAKYDVVAIVRDIEFSNDTYNDTYNAFSQYISQSANPEALEKNAGSYADVMAKTAADGMNFELMVQDQKNLATAAHTIGQVNYNPYTGQSVAELPGTHEAVKWVFDAAQEGSVSKLFDRVGDGKRLLVVSVTKIHPEGYLDLASVKDELTAEVIRDKKFDQLSKKLAAVKTIDAAAQQGARVDTVSRITFGHATVNGVSDRRLSGAVVGTPEGQFSKKVVKGDNAAYVFQVIERKQREGVQFDAVAAERQQVMNNMQMANYVLQELHEKAKVVDLRYKW